MAYSTTGDETRPDGRISDEPTLQLRAATRALRLHLDELPVVFHHAGPADQFLAEVAFPLARQRYACAESLIGAGFGGTVVGALARSLLEDGLRWQWIAQAADERRPSLLGSMLDERNRILSCLEDSDASCPILARWFAPFYAISDMTGASLPWLSAPSVPTAADLLDQFLAQPELPHAGPPTTSGTSPGQLLASARSMLTLSGLRGAVMVLEHAGHGNLLGLQSSLTRDGVAGADLRPDHEALFLHVAAVGVTVTLLGVCIAAPASWPEEVEQQAFLTDTLRLTTDVASAATVIHGLRSTRTTPPRTSRTKVQPREARLRPQALLSHEALLPDINSAEDVIAATEAYSRYRNSWFINPHSQTKPKLVNVLAYLGTYSTFETVMATYDGPSAVTATFAARMLLEEAARFTWLSHHPADGPPSDEELTARSTRYFDQWRAREKKTLGALVSNGVPQAVAARLLQLPENVIQGPQEITKGREPLPRIEAMLRLMGAPYPEPGWLVVAYSLLSQVTHSTPIGYLHMVRQRSGQPHIGDISPEMLALTLDAACLSSAELLGMSTAILTGGSQKAIDYAVGLRRRALEVHDTARMVHGLD
ncbi:hypothetical protein [Streptomyces sp. WMMB 322]|uniref:hypothetical protein n=1 Tax=Streptomyces sp. WMMB 322 TaxID=1286821 RepID=UPI000823E64D|nr:hypothetical protein [Streptomyces sp. WMMB 322]SCK09493.1 hypothetical protein H180DRAFT_00470 [Streptomyces sp. WMMB 322]